MLKVYQMFCAIWYHLCNLKNVKNTHGRISLLEIRRLLLLKVILLDACFYFFN